MLDPHTLKIIIQASIPIAEELVKHIGEHQTKLNELSQKFDQVFLREIKSAFEAIEDAQLANDVEIRKRRLNFAEDQLLRCTGLDLHIKIGDYLSAYWVGLSHFGLATICKIRLEEELLIRHVIKTFIADPRMARVNHFPQIFKNLFDNECTEQLKWYNQALIHNENDNFAGKILRDRALKVGQGAPDTL